MSLDRVSPMCVVSARGFVVAGWLGAPAVLGSSLSEAGTACAAAKPVLSWAAMARCRPSLLLRVRGWLMGSCHCERVTTPPLTVAMSVV